MIRNLSWTNKWFSAGWSVLEASGTREYLFSKRKLRGVPRNLRDRRPAALRGDFDSIFVDQHFTKWWDQSCGGTADKFLRLVFPGESSPWDIPWELLVERLEETNVHSTISLVRTLDVNPPHAKSVFDKPLRILVLLGDDGKKINRPLNLTAEVRRIQDAWKSLSLNLQKNIDEPQIINALSDRLAEDLGKYQPNLIWFSGHGRIKPESSLLFADGKWITARELANLIQAARQPPRNAYPPLYAVFWACDSARAEDQPASLPSAPTLFTELTKAGVLSVLAMQSPIRDVSALSMARGAGVFSGWFSARACFARVLRPSLDNLPNGAHPLDWATPVVWTAASSTTELTWTVVTLFTRFQLFDENRFGCGD